MGYLLTSDQQTKGCRAMGMGEQGPSAFPQPLYFIVSMRPGMTKGYGNMRPQFKIEIHTVLRNLFADNVCVLHM